MTNPYHIHDPKAFRLRYLGIKNGFTIFMVHLSSAKGIEACNFRGHLSNFIIKEMDGEAHLGNDERFIRNTKHNLVLAVKENTDIDKLKKTYWVK